MKNKLRFFFTLDLCLKEGMLVNMRILVTFAPIKEEKIKLPVGYQYIIRDIILNLINNGECKEYTIGQNYKLYSFSKLFGDCKYNEEDKTIIFDNEIKLVISTVLLDMIQCLTKALEGNIITIWNQAVKIKDIQIYKEIEIFEEEEIYMLSPCCVYKTYIDEQNIKKIQYYSPQEKEFKTLIKKNIISKYTSYYNQTIENLDFSIEPLGNNKEMVTLYKGNYVIRAYKGNYLLKGNKDLIKLAYDTGLGGKNGYGFGCIELKNIEKRRKQKEN